MESLTTRKMRQAAQLMRDRAKAATPGQWTATERYPFLVLQPDAAEPMSSVSTNLAGAPEADAAHIAGWHPAVAIAVADWLDSVAFAIENNTPEGVEVAHAGQAVAVTLAYLNLT